MAKDARRSNRYLIGGPSDARDLLHPAPWFGYCMMIGRAWARGGSDWVAEKRAGGGGVGRGGVEKVDIGQRMDDGE